MKIKKTLIVIGCIFITLYGLYKYLDYIYDQPRILGQIDIENAKGYYVEIDRGARDFDWENAWVDYYFRIGKKNQSLTTENKILDKIISQDFKTLINSDYGYSLREFKAKVMDSIFFIKITTHQIEYPYFFDFKSGISTYESRDFLDKIKNLSQEEQTEKLDSIQIIRDSIQDHIKSIDK